MKAATKIMIALICMSVVDMIIPIPILGIILIYVVLQKPRWFRDLVGEIYAG